MAKKEISTLESKSKSNNEKSISDSNETTDEVTKPFTEKLYAIIAYLAKALARYICLWSSLSLRGDFKEETNFNSST